MFPLAEVLYGKKEKFSLQAENGMALKCQFPSVLSILFKEQQQNRLQPQGEGLGGTGG